jgi:O-antigen ligase
MLISIFWSEFPFVSLKRWIKTAGTVVMALVLLSESDPYEAIQQVLRRMAYVLIPLSLLLVKYYPHLGVVFGRWSGGRMWIGVSMTKNTLGLVCAISAFFLVWSWVRRREGKIPVEVKYLGLADLMVFGMSLWLLKGPGTAFSATSTGVLIVGLAIFFALRKVKNPEQKLGSIVSLAILGTVLVYGCIALIFGTTPMSIAANFFGRDDTLTGRTDLIWSVLVPLAWMHPIIGIGYGSFWIKPVFEFVINQAHNGYLDILIELGLIGIVLFGFVVISFFFKAKRESQFEPDWAYFRIAILLMSLFHNITETSYLRSTAPLWNLFIFLMVIHPTLGRKKEKLLEQK